jgi:hypothetical protein
VVSELLIRRGVGSAGVRDSGEKSWSSELWAGGCDMWPGLQHLSRAL